MPFLCTRFHAYVHALNMRMPDNGPMLCEGFRPPKAVGVDFAPTDKRSTETSTTLPHPKQSEKSMTEANVAEGPEAGTPAGAHQQLLAVLADLDYVYTYVHTSGRRHL